MSEAPPEAGELVVRPATRADMVEVAEMIQELADFENMSDGPKLSAEDLVRDGFDTSPPLFSCLVAAPRGGGGGCAGYALWFPTYSTWRGGGAQLEDLFVRAAWRGRGAGGRLLAAAAAAAAAAGAARVDLHVLGWNPARELYLRRGFVDLTEAEQWRYCRAAGPALAALAARAGPAGDP